MAVLCLLALGSARLHARDQWIVLTDCRLDEDASNDADSFHVKAAGQEYIFRLYFADAAETDASFPERIAEQAKYFGATPQQTVQLGKVAQKFVREKLARPFTVRTSKQDAMGRSKKPRYYAFVETSEGDLAELLVANGLARVHGRAASAEGLGTAQHQWRKLQRLEREAKAQKIGGWGAMAGRMTARLPTKPANAADSSFDAFFHPERVEKPPADVDVSAAPPPVLTRSVPRSTPSTPAVAPVGPPGSAVAAKLDVNSATADELMKIRGIGPVLAQRIIEARPLESADALRKVKGIGAKTYEKIRPSFL